MKTGRRLLGLWIWVLFLTGGCVSLGDRVLDSGTPALQVRSVQTRVFDTDDREGMLRAVIATLQDLGFVIAKADATLAAVSGSAVAETGLAGLRMTVTVSPRGPKRMSVRGNAQIGLSPITEPEPYQRFFAALERTIFLTAHEME